MMKRAADLAKPKEKALASQVFNRIDTRAWHRIESALLDRNIILSGTSGTVRNLGTTIRYALVGQYLTVEILDSMLVTPEDAIKMIADVINEARA